jgi:hypothetical protein
MGALFADALGMDVELNLKIAQQPDDSTCGPTCLHAIYHYFRDPVELTTVIEEVPVLAGGGTLGVMLANHALRRGYTCSIYTYNLMIYDPTWFEAGVDIKSRLEARAAHTSDKKQKLAIRQYIEFIDNSGKLYFHDLTRSLLRKFLRRRIPILTGLNSTYLYRTMRAFGPTMADDDIRGEVVGHFVVLCGYRESDKTVLVADPYLGNPYSKDRLYAIPMDRVIGAILLGVMTYDANFMIIEPKTKQGS